MSLNSLRLVLAPPFISVCCTSRLGGFFLLFVEAEQKFVWSYVGNIAFFTIRFSTIVVLTYRTSHKVLLLNLGPHLLLILSSLKQQHTHTIHPPHSFSFIDSPLERSEPFFFWKLLCGTSSLLWFASHDRAPRIAIICRHLRLGRKRNLQCNVSDSPEWSSNFFYIKSNQKSSFPQSNKDNINVVDIRDRRRCHYQAQLFVIRHPTSFQFFQFCEAHAGLHHHHHHHCRRMATME